MDRRLPCDNNGLHRDNGKKTWCVRVHASLGRGSIIARSFVVTIKMCRSRRVELKALFFPGGDGGAYSVLTSPDSKAMLCRLRWNDTLMTNGRSRVTNLIYASQRRHIPVRPGECVEIDGVQYRISWKIITFIALVGCYWCCLFIGK